MTYAKHHAITTLHLLGKRRAWARGDVRFDSAPWHYRVPIRVRCGGLPGPTVAMMLPWGV